MNTDLPQVHSPLPDLPVVDLVEQAYFDDPYPLLERARSESAVVGVRAQMMIRGTGLLLTRHSDVRALYADRRFSSDRMAQPGIARVARFLPPIVRLLGETMVMRDDPDHRRLRDAVSSAFTPRFVAGLESSITATAQDLVDDLVRRGDADLVADFAVELPLRVIADMLGISDRDRDAFAAIVVRMHRLPSGKLALIRKMRLMKDLMGVLERVISDKRAHPADDLVSAIIAAGSDGDVLTDREVLAMVFLMFLAGHDTTSNLISGSVLALIDNPDQRAALRGDPALWSTAVDELLRYVTPVTTGSVRFPTEDVSIGDREVAAGTQVVGLILAANRDSDVFTDPNELDLNRSPNPHLSFAFGPHFCLGHHLARSEAEMGLRVLLDRCPDIALAVPRDSLSYRPDLTMRSLWTLPVHVGTPAPGR